MLFMLIVISAWMFIQLVKRYPARIKDILEYYEVLKPKEETKNHGETDS
jgi:hypothetical protein